MAPGALYIHEKGGAIETRGNRARVARKPDSGRQEGEGERSALPEHRSFLVILNQSRTRNLQQQSYSYIQKLGCNVDSTQLYSPSITATTIAIDAQPRPLRLPP